MSIRISTLLFSLCFLLSIIAVRAQDDGSYKLPPKAIADMLLARPSPNVIMDDKGEWMLLTDISLYPSVEELARPELKIAGLRINPRNYAPSRQNFISNIRLKNIHTGLDYTITGLPSPLFAGNINWSPDNKKIAFTQTTKDRVDLYVIDVSTRKSTKVNKNALNVLIGNYQWLDNQSLLYRIATRPSADAPSRPLMPKGPTTQENTGKASPRPTFQDMIKSPYDEQLFEFYATAQLVKNVNGAETRIGQPDMLGGLSLSPDKKYMLVRRIRKPFSYLVPVQGFPATVSITDLNGKTVKVLAELPSRSLELLGLMRQELKRYKGAFDFYSTPFPQPLLALLHT